MMLWGATQLGALAARLQRGRRREPDVRAREPDQEGYVDRDGVKVAYEAYGQQPGIAIVFAPVDTIVHSRAWKAQVPYLARHHRVVTIDPRGNGRSDRP